MAVKDKLVTLEDLKTAYDKLKEMMDMYEDITSSLTWSNATWVPNITSGTLSKDSTAATIAGVKVTKITVSKGERYRVNGWWNNIAAALNISPSCPTIPLALTNASDTLISIQGPVTLEANQTKSTHYGEATITIPASAKYLYIFDFGGHANISRTVGDSIVEKSI